jgi:hypothetical protein
MPMRCRGVNDLKLSNPIRHFITWRSGDTLFYFIYLMIGNMFVCRILLFERCTCVPVRVLYLL